MNITELFKEIDKTKMIYDIWDLAEDEFNIYNILEDQKENRLGYVFYKSWICTDTMVGIKLWVFDGEPVCVSYQPGRKMDTDYYWVSRQAKILVKTYIDSLYDDDEDYSYYLDESTIDSILEDIKIKGKLK